MNPHEQARLYENEIKKFAKKIIKNNGEDIIIDNSDNSKNYLVLGALRKQIIENVDNVFGFNWKKYGSGWDFEVNQLCVRPLGKIS